MFDTTLKAQLAPLHSALSHNVITPAEAARDFLSLLADFLGGEDVFSGGEGRDRRSGRSSADISDEAFLHAKREKKRLQRLVFGSNWRVGQNLRAQFYQAVKLVTLSDVNAIRGSGKGKQGDRKRVFPKIFGLSPQEQQMVQ